MVNQGPVVSRPSRAIVVIWDGLRPDLVSSERTPTLTKLAEQGVTFSRMHATFPSETRVNTASFATGSWPTAHGIVANEMFHPAVDPRSPFSTGDAAHLMALDRATEGQLLGVPSLGEVLREARARYVVASAGSSGNAYLLNHRATPASDPRSAALVHWDPAMTQPAVLSENVLARFGAAPPRAVPNSGVCDWLTGVFCDMLLPEVWAAGAPGVAVLWLSEPDVSQHAHGIGSPAALQALRENDSRLARLIETLEDLGCPAVGPDATTALFVGSDHGFATVRPAVPLRQVLDEAGLLDDQTVVSRTGVYLRDNSTAKRDAIARHLLAQPGNGMVITRDGKPAGTIPLPLLQLDHPRAPDVAISAAWTDDANAFGWPGTAGSPVSIAADHGGASPYELRSTLVAVGPGFRRGVVADRPSGIVDLAPTILQLLGIAAPRRWMGRSLVDLLDAAAPGPGRGQEWQRHEFAAIDGSNQPRHLFISRTDSGGYLDRAEFGT
ncbi:MAG TPA: alkaline phosphatase family protein [Chloroflexota bacterium]|nr:alkaline phosphatase family protein [Chloroflexota bacterium]